MPSRAPLPSTRVAGALNLITGTATPPIHIGVDPGKQGAIYLRNSDGSCLTWAAWWWQPGRGGRFSVVTGPTLRRFEVPSMAALGAKLGRALAAHPDRRYVLHMEALHVRMGRVNPQTTIGLAWEAGRLQGALEALAGPCLVVGEQPSPSEWSRMFLPKWTSPTAEELSAMALEWALGDRLPGDTWAEADLPAGMPATVAEARAMAHWGAAPEAVEGHWDAKAHKAAKAVRKRAKQKAARAALATGAPPKAEPVEGVQGVPGMNKQRKRMPSVL